MLEESQAMHSCMTVNSEWYMADILETYFEEQTEQGKNQA
jgi:hypothetical protein